MAADVLSATAPRASPAWYRWVNLALTQVAWFIAVSGGARDRWWPGVAAVAVVVALDLVMAADPERLAMRLGCAVLIGFAADAVLGLAGACTWHGGALDGRLPPPWLTALWPNFAVLLTGSLAWLVPRPWLAVLLGAIGGPLAYAGGARMGAMGFPAGTVIGLGAIGMMWAAATPLLAYLARPLPSVKAEAAHA